MIFNLNWIPEFYFFENKVRNPFNLDKVIDLIEQKIKKKEIQKNTIKKTTIRMAIIVR